MGVVCLCVGGAPAPTLKHTHLHIHTYLSWPAELKLHISPQVRATARPPTQDHKSVSVRGSRCVWESLIRHVVGPHFCGLQKSSLKHDETRN